jgi:amidase
MAAPGGTGAAACARATIAIVGPEKGDVLAVQIRSMLPRGPQPGGTTAIFPEFGGLVGTSQTAMLNPPIPDRVKKMEDERGYALLRPHHPAPRGLHRHPRRLTLIEAVSALQPDYWGGNMDLPDMAPGAIGYFPVQRPEAHVFIGDCHGRRGDGELCGVAVEIPAIIEFGTDLTKGWTIPGPRLDIETETIAIGSARPMEDAARMAYRDLVRSLVADYGFEESEAYLLCTPAGQTRLGNMVDPKYTIGAAIRKAHRRAAP